MDSKTRIITIRASYKNDNSSSKELQEKTIAIDHDQFRDVKDKDTFIRLLKHYDMKFPEDISMIKLIRKSKKNKNYIPLESEKDFKSLARSLKVKNHIKLIIVDKTLNESKPNFLNSTIRKKAIDFSSLGDALIEVAIDHFKDIIFDFKRPDIKEEGTLQEEHSIGHQDSTDDTVHVNVCCDRCHPNDFVPIRGVRYSCLVCPDFDLCESCERELHKTGQDFHSHSLNHPLAKIIRESPSFNRSKFERFQGSTPTAPPCYHSSDDIILADIPLRDYNPENKVLIEQLINNSGFKSFAENVQHYLKTSERYVTLTSLLKDSNLNEDEAFDLLKSFVINGISKKDSVQSLNSCDDATPLSSENTFALTIKNMSPNVIEGNNLKFEFVDGDQNDVFIVKNSEPIYPGKQNTYDITSMKPKLQQSSLPKTLRVSNVDSDVSLVGLYSAEAPSYLELYKVLDTTEEPLMTSPKEETEQVFTDDDKVIVTLVPKSPSLAQIMISNRSSKKIDCSDLTLEVLNCFEDSVLSVLVHKKHGILPGKVSKFNISLSNYHLKYPFKIVMKNGSTEGRCKLSMNELSGRFKFSNQGSNGTNDEYNLEFRPSEYMLTNETSSSTEGVDDDDDEQLGECDAPGQQSSMNNLFSSTTRTSDVASGAGSLHSMVLPALPRESVTNSRLSTSEYIDATTSIHGNNLEDEIEDDYDIISAEGDAEDKETIDSDFEVLSPVNSNSQG
ncbi:uncharacterized protein PRCAT00002959001 [Priceomyces carsonii]|uniref:uncharacterized protein n=1 Tax=Priceomyces carsonii TaxID=28549 RepID=UPI002EDA017E|nr:unnamed protein product [Priceomyces carsonii]